MMLYASEAVFSLSLSLSLFTNNTRSPDDILTERCKKYSVLLIWVISVHWKKEK